MPRPAPKPELQRFSQMDQHMSAMFDFISGKKRGKMAELKATLEHVMTHCVPEPDYNRLRDALIAIDRSPRGISPESLRKIARRALKKSKSQTTS